MADPKNGGKKIKKGFLALAAFRVERAQKLIKGLKRQAVRASFGNDFFDAAIIGLNAVAAQFAALPTDFKPAKAALGQPMTVGTVVEIVAKERAKLSGLMTDSIINGAWTVEKATASDVYVRSNVDTSATQLLARRRVQLPGIVRVPRKLTPEQQAAKDAKKAAKQATKPAKKAVAPTATL